VLLSLVAWMVARARRDLRGRARPWLLHPLFGVMVLASVAGAHETARESADRRAFPIPGQLIDVGGYRLHLHCTGSGSPTVVLLPGAGGFSPTWGWIAPADARQVCARRRPHRHRARRGDHAGVTRYSWPGPR
jgi:hypothetical protein